MNNTKVKGRDLKHSNSAMYDYITDKVKPNTFNFDFQPKIIKPIFNAIRTKSVRTPNDTIILSIIATMVEKFSFFRIATTSPMQNTIITSNIYSITYTKSGAGKDLSASITNDIFEGFNQEIQNSINWAIKRYEQDVDRVIALQNPENKEKIEELKASKFLSHISYIQTESTNEGIIENMRTFMKIGIGSITWRVQEMGDMLLQNKEGSLNMKLVKELYDSSSTYNKQIKSASQSSVSGVPFNVVGYTAPQGLFDDKNKKKIQQEMSRGMVRRFHTIMPIEKDYPDLRPQELTKEERLNKLKNNKKSILAIEEFQNKFRDIAIKLQKTLYENIEIKYKDIEDSKTPGLTHLSRVVGKLYEWSDDAAVYFDEYNDYINYKWSKAPNGKDEQVSDLAYKTLKLIPIYCALNNHNIIQEKDVRQAIYIVEYFSSHLNNLNSLINENSINEVEENKIFKFLKSNIGTYYSKSDIHKKAKLTKQKERETRYLEEAREIANDDENYEFEIKDEKIRGKSITKYGLVEIEDIKIDLENTDEN